MRQVFLDNTAPENEIRKISFYSAREGYVAFRDWIGFTTDSGHTFTKKPITLSNVNISGYSVNLTFGFGISGVKAFDKNTLLAWGHYGLVPAILSSTDGGNNFKLVFHSQFDQMQLRTGVTDMIFPENNSVGYAIDADRILKTTDRGLNWSIVKTEADSYFDFLEAPDNNNVFAGSRDYKANKLVRTADGGSSWQQVTYPVAGGKMQYACFLNPSTGWMSIRDDRYAYFYATTNGGSSWTLLNDREATPFATSRMRFTDANTGYAFSGQNTVFKTTDGGITWEPLPRDNAFAYLGYSHNDLHFLNNNQFWAGGGHGLLELSTNSGGTPLAKSYFKIDTAGLSATGIVNLKNYSRSSYTFKWLVNEKSSGTSYHSSYTPDFTDLTDTIKLIVTNGSSSDTTVKYVQFYPQVIVSAFSPSSGKTGAPVTITGKNFDNVTAVTFGGERAGFSVLSPTTILATVGQGASGKVTVYTRTGSGSLAGFTYLPPPAISAFSPLSATAGTAITITGTNFNDVTTVTIGNVPATFTVVSSTTINAIAPSSGSGDVTVVTTGGSASQAGFVSIPTIVSFTPIKGTEGTIMTITGTSFTGTTSVSIGNKPALSFTVQSSTTITAIVGAEATGSVKVTSPGGNSILPGFTWYPNPVISSFSPMSGPVGTSITILGSNFHATPSQNVVYFGSIRATITSGTTTSLTVKVPVGASFEPINVLSNNLRACSATPFLVTFPNGGSITGNSFADSAVVNTSPDYYPQKLQVGDVDGDGKLDLVVSAYGNLITDNGIFIYRNTGTATTVSFGKPLFLPLEAPDAISLGDLDGDGKPELAATNDTTINIYRNLSTTGNLAMAPPTMLPSANGLSGIIMGDVDGDGKPDIATCYFHQYGTSIYRNTSEPGNILFATPMEIAAPGGRNILLTDLTGDNKPELVVPQATDTKLYVVTNKSVKGQVKFDTPVTYAGYTLSYAAAADMDGDGRTDIVMGDYWASRMVVRRNMGAGVLADPVQFDATSSPSGIALADLDGDGKPDIATGLWNANRGVFKNLSEPGDISLATKLNYGNPTNPGEHMIAIGDFNEDGKSDIVDCSGGNQSISIHFNSTKAEPFVQSFTPAIGKKGTSVTITGYNFSGVNSVKFGGVSAASFVVNSSTSITAIVDNGSSGEVAVTSSLGTAVKAGFSFGLPPVISSFTPLSASTGTSVTISGTGFSTTAADNIVNFGGVKAIVTAASSTSLTVTVPAGASYQPITVTCNNLIAYSSDWFSPSFPGGTTTITAASFAAPVTGIGGSGSFCDLDGDGKLDLMIANNNDLVLERNQSSPGFISFDQMQVIPAGLPRANPVAGDLDGDGRPDIIGISHDGHSFVVFRNTSNIGNITVEKTITQKTGVDRSDPMDGLILDIDQDGKPEVIVVNYSARTLSVFRNLSTPGNIMLDNRIDFGFSYYPTGVTARDVDGDGKPDILVSSISEGSEGVAVFRNTSVPGAIRFANKVDYPANEWPSGIAGADFDGDGKTDIAVTNFSSNDISIIPNNSSSGNINFAPRLNFPTGKGPWNFTAGDLNGDGKPDLATANLYTQNISVLCNNSTAGSISMLPGVDLPIGRDPDNIVIADVDNDGRPDIVTGGAGITVFLRNIIGTGIPVSVCPGADTSIISDITGTSYQWQQNDGNGFVDIANDSHFSGSSTASLHLKNIPKAWSSYQYRCVVNAMQNSTVYVLDISRNAVTPFAFISTTAKDICAGTAVTFRAVSDNGGTNPSWQWQVNGVNTGSDTSIFTTTALTNNAQVRVIMTSNAICAAPVMDTSNTIAMVVNATVAPTVSIAYSPSPICTGAPVTFTASPSTVTGTESYQWKKNNLAVGGNYATYTDNSLQTGDLIQVVMNTLSTCLPGTPILSNTITIALDASPVPAVNITGSTDVVAGSTVVVTANPINCQGSSTYQWQDSTKSHGWQNIAFATTAAWNYQPMQQGDKLRMLLSCTSPCGTTFITESNVLVFNLLSLQAGSGMIAPNPVTNGMLVIDSLNTLDGWQTLDIFDLGGTLQFHMNLPPVYPSRISIPISSLPRGNYIALLRRNNGLPLRLRFIKL
ncbi:FG-GAP-like repeat-containing protein [Flavihumibacter petaseus]|nr:FG-GAP-like repeat-containing protein [Flavihumibacter petaseus]